jgi:hypothetical protein
LDGADLDGVGDRAGDRVSTPGSRLFGRDRADRVSSCEVVEREAEDRLSAYQVDERPSVQQVEGARLVEQLGTRE